LDSGNIYWIISLPESVRPTASLGGIPLEKSNGLVISITTFPAKFFGSAIFMELDIPSYEVASTLSSANDAASAYVPDDAFPTSPP
jgi:hypothetical protein